MQTYSSRLLIIHDLFSNLSEKETLSCEILSLENQTNLKIKCSAPPVCTDCSLNFRFNSGSFNKTYECNISDIAIDETLPQSIQYCATNTLVAVLNDPLGLNTATVWGPYEWQVTPEFKPEDFNFSFDCAPFPRQNNEQNCSAFSSQSLNPPVIRYTLDNKWKQCRGANYTINLRRDISCSLNPAPSFSVVHTEQGLFSSQPEKITDIIDKDDITFSSTYEFEVIVTTLDQNNQSKTVSHKKENNSS